MKYVYYVNILLRGLFCYFTQLVLLLYRYVISLRGLFCYFTQLVLLLYRYVISLVFEVFVFMVINDGFKTLLSTLLQLYRSFWEEMQFNQTLQIVKIIKSLTLIVYIYYVSYLRLYLKQSSQRLLNYLPFKYFGFERTWWRLFQNGVMWTKF